MPPPDPSPEEQFAAYLAGIETERPRPRRDLPTIVVEALLILGSVALYGAIGWGIGRGMGIW